MRLSKIIAHNIFCFEHIEVNFRELQLILGINTDDTGADSNGTGKSALIDVFTVVNFNKTVCNDEIIRDGQDGGYGESHYDNGLVVRREFGKILKSEQSPLFNYEIASALRIYKEKDLTCHGIGATQQKLYELMGVAPNFSFQDFLNTCFLTVSTEKILGSKDLTSQDRTDLISHFLNLAPFKQATVDCRADKRQTGKDKLRVGSDMGQILAERESLILKSGRLSDMKEQQEKVKGLIKRLNRKFTELQKQAKGFQELNKLRAELEVLQSKQRMQEKAVKESSGFIGKQIKDIQIEIQALKSQGVDVKRTIDEMQKKADKLEELQKGDSVKQLEELIKDKEGKTAKLVIGKGELVVIEQQIKQAQKCPKCKTELVVIDGKIDRLQKDKLVKHRAELESSVKKLVEGLKRVDEKVLEYDTMIKQKSQAAQGIEEGLEALKTVEYELTTKKAKLKEWERDSKSQKEQHKKDMEQTAKGIKVTEKKLEGYKEKGGQENALNELVTNKDALEQAQSELANVNTGLEYMLKLKERYTRLKQEQESLQKQIEVLTFWEEGFPAIERRIIQSFLPALEEKTNQYLRALDSDLRVSVESLQKLKDKQETYREKLNFRVADSVSSFMPLKSKSQGQLRRLGICFALALRQLIKEQDRLPFDFLLIDEVFDGLDYTGQQQVLKLLDDIKGQKLLISHSSHLKDRFENVITLVKKDGISRVEK